MKIGNVAFTTYVHKAPKVAGFFDKGQIMELHHHKDWSPSCEELGRFNAAHGKWGIERSWTMKR